MTTTATPADVASTAPHRERTATVTLFKRSGKYYTSESWRVPAGAINPYQMVDSVDFHQINGGAVLVEADALPEFPDDENWGVPHLVFAPANAEVLL